MNDMFGCNFQRVFICIPYDDVYLKENIFYTVIQFSLNI